MDIILMAAMTKKRVIGKDNKLPWSIPEELQFFRATTLGKVVIMGRKTYDSVGRPMPKRRNMVVSRSAPTIEGVEVFSSIERAVSAAKASHTDIFIIGGEEIFRQSLSIANKIYLSIIKEEYDGDTFFPEFSLHQWKEVKREDKGSFEFVEYCKITH